MRERNIRGRDSTPTKAERRRTTHQERTTPNESTAPPKKNSTTIQGEYYKPNPNSRPIPIHAQLQKKKSGRESPPPLPTNAEDLKCHKALSSMESTSTVSSTDDAPGSGSSSSDPSALGAALGSITSKPALALTSKPTAVVKVKAEDVAFIVSLSLSLSPFPIQGCRCLMSDV